jgi:hypothetical protein
VHALYSSAIQYSLLYPRPCQVQVVVIFLSDGAPSDHSERVCMHNVKVRLFDSFFIVCRLVTTRTFALFAIRSGPIAKVP